MSLGDFILPFLVNWFLLFVGCYLVVEFAQKYLYDEATPRLGLKILGGSLLLALLLTWTRSGFDTMFTTSFGWTVIQAVVWFAVFTLIFQFQPQHAALIGIVAMVLMTGTASLAVDSLNSSGRPRPTARTPSKAVRRPSSSFSAPAAPAPATAPAKSP